MFVYYSLYFLLAQADTLNDAPENVPEKLQIATFPHENPFYGQPDK